MLNSLREDYGQYLTGFFIISLDMELKENTEGNSLDNFTEEEYATFVHEYTHYLQNITTTYGVNYFNDNSKFIQLCISESYKYDKKIPCPLEIETCGVENAYAEMELRSFYLGNDEHKKIHHINEIKVENDEIIELVLSGEKLEAVNIYYDDMNKPYMFGTSCIEESMAYLIESEKFSGLHRMNELPYNSCELVCQQLCPHIKNRKDIIVALAELSLMHYHSGKMFVELLEHINAKNLTFENTKDVAMYFKNCIPHLFKNHEKNYKETDKTVDFLYPLDTPFEKVNSWLKEALKQGFHYRTKYSNLISRMMDLTEEQCKIYFCALVKTFNFPLLCDKNNDMFGGETDLALALVPVAIYYTYLSEKKQCYLYKYCKKNEMPTLNNNCTEAPWLQSAEEALCPFGKFWQYYSLADKIIEK